MIQFLIIVLVAAILIYAVIVSGVGKRSGSYRSSRANGGRRDNRSRLDRAMVIERWATIQAMSLGGGMVYAKPSRRPINSLIT